jgi:hypothetical protein
MRRIGGVTDIRIGIMRDRARRAGQHMLEIIEGGARTHDFGLREGRREVKSGGGRGWPGKSRPNPAA